MFTNLLSEHKKLAIFFGFLKAAFVAGFHVLLKAGRILCMHNVWRLPDFWGAFSWSSSWQFVRNSLDYSHFCRKGFELFVGAYQGRRLPTTRYDRKPWALGYYNLYINTSNWNRIGCSYCQWTVAWESWWYIGDVIVQRKRTIIEGAAVLGGVLL